MRRGKGSDGSDWGVFLSQRQQMPDMPREQWAPAAPVQAEVEGWTVYDGQYTKQFEPADASPLDMVFNSWPNVRIRDVPFAGWMAEKAAGTGGVWFDYLNGQAYPSAVAAMLAVELALANET